MDDAFLKTSQISSEKENKASYLATGHWGTVRRDEYVSCDRPLTNSPLHGSCQQTNKQTSSGSQKEIIKLAK
jgi:hypothetical protein